MHLTATHIEHSNDGWKVEFIGDDGDEVIVKSPAIMILRKGMSSSELALSWCN